MHPRQDVTHHVLVPELLMRGFAVWTQGSRSVGNDLSLVHEQGKPVTEAGGEIHHLARSVHAFGLEQGGGVGALAPVGEAVEVARARLHALQGGGVVALAVGSVQDLQHESRQAMCTRHIPADKS